jgi:hypothetical protein
MRRDIHTRYKYLTRMASIIYQVQLALQPPPAHQVEDLSVLDEIARIVSGCELETEFSKAFSTSKEPAHSGLMKRWGAADTEVDKFLKKINELYMISVKGVAAKSSVTGSISLKSLVKQLKQLL